jgi:pimeloyl-ACP methyl ester carboxylesterase
VKLEVLEYLPEAQSEKPPLLFVHGGSHGAWCWQEHFLPYFAEKGFPSYALSFRGHGESAGKESLDSFSVTDYADDVLQVMHQFQEKPVLLGHSLGGTVVQRVWHAQPDAVRAIVLLSSTPPMGMFKAWMKIIPAQFRMIYKMHMYNRGEKVTRAEKTIERLLFPFSAPVAKSPIFPRVVAEKLLLPRNLPQEKKNEYLRRLQPESLVAAESMIRQELDPASMSRDVPILVLGSKKDMFFSEKMALLTAEAYKTKAIIFSDLCHDMMLDPQWKTAADTINTFLQEHFSPQKVESLER